MTDMNSVYTPQSPQNYPRPRQGQGNSSLESAAPGRQSNNQNPMLTTMYASEDQNTATNPMNNTVHFDTTPKLAKMQIVDEADETESINRPSFFDAINAKKQGPFEAQKPAPLAQFGTVTQQKTTAKTQNLHFMTPSQTRLRQESSQAAATLSASPSSAQKSTLILQQTLKDQRNSPKDERIASPKRPKVPSFSLPPRSKIITTQGMTGQVGTKGGGLHSTRGASQIVNLKPINQTGLNKFKAPYKTTRTSTIDTGLSSLKKKSTSIQPASPLAPPAEAPSPYQMMLEEMKLENRGGDLGPIRPTVEEMDDFKDFQGGEETLEGSPGVNFLAFEQKLERMMQTYSSAFNEDEMNQTMISQLTEAQKQAFKFPQQTIDKGGQSRHTKQYFRNQPPLQDTFTKLLMEKFRETNAQFKNEARNLLEDLRRQEQMSMSSRNGNAKFAKTAAGDMQKLTVGQRTFGGRTGSLAPQFSAKNKSIKEQLRELKLAEVNKLNGDSSSQKSRSLVRRRNTDFENLNKTGFETQAGKNDNDYVDQFTPVLVRRADPGSRQMPWQVTASLHSTSRESDAGQVQYSFKKFKLDSQKDHTKHILPSMKKLI